MLCAENGKPVSYTHLQLGGGIHVVAEAAQLVDTHLEAGAGTGGVFREHQRDAPAPVSYTHLDDHREHHSAQDVAAALEQSSEQHTEEHDEVSSCLLYTSRCV